MPLRQLTSLLMSCSLLFTPLGALAEQAAADRLDAAAALAASAVSAADGNAFETAADASAKALEALGSAEGRRFTRGEGVATVPAQAPTVDQAALTAKIEGLDEKEKQQIVELLNAGDTKMLTHRDGYGYVHGWTAGFVAFESPLIAMWDAGSHGVSEPLATLLKIGAVIYGFAMYIPALLVATFLTGPIVAIAGGGA